MKIILPGLVFFMFLAAAAPEQKPPGLIREVLPTYPKNAQSMDITGWVIVRFDVDVEGRVENVEIIESHDEGPVKSKYVRQNFEKNSLKAIRKFRFEPGTPATGLLHQFTFGVYAGYGSILYQQLLMTGGDRED